MQVVQRLLATARIVNEQLAVLEHAAEQGLFDGHIVNLHQRRGFHLLVEDAMHEQHLFGRDREP